MSPTIWAVLSGVAAYFGTGLLLVFLSEGTDPPPVFGYIAVAVGIAFGVFVYRSRKART
jgi:hypothetical protein